METIVRFITVEEKEHKLKSKTNHLTFTEKHLQIIESLYVGSSESYF